MKYRLIGKLDSGGMAEVHLAVAEGVLGIEKLVVIKRLRPELACQEDYLAMFLDEARLVAHLHHPNVVQAFELGESDGTRFIVMEFLEGQPLSRVRRKAVSRGGIPLGLHLKILSDALLGLHYAHELTDRSGTPLSVVHRDLNPRNIFIGYDGQVKILDFGIARTASTIVDSDTGWLKGKLSYMPPEQVYSERVDRTADIFSMGVMLCEAITQRRFWADAEETTILRRLVQNDLPWLSADLAVFEGLAPICDRALAPDPCDRYETAAAMQAALDAYLAQSPWPVGSREIGRLVRALFAEERQAFKNVLATEVMKTTPGPGPARAEPPWNSTAEAVSNDAGPERVSTSGDGSPVPFDREAALERDTGRFESSALLEPLARTLLPVSPRARHLSAGLLAAGALAMIGIWKLARAPLATVRNERSTTAVPATHPERVEPRIEARPFAGSTRFLKLAASPPAAQLFLDGAPLPSNPFQGNYPADGLFHNVHVEAAGYLAESRDIRFDRDSVIELSLSPAPRGVAHSPSHAVHSPPKLRYLNLPRARPARRPLDRSNPWVP